MENAVLTTFAEIPMRQKPPHSPSWMAFSHAALAIALVANAYGLWSAPLDVWVKGCLGMGELLALFAAVNLTKSKRDMEEFHDAAREAGDGPWIPAPAKRA